MVVELPSPRECSLQAEDENRYRLRTLGGEVWIMEAERRARGVCASTGLVLTIGVLFATSAMAQTVRRGPEVVFERKHDTSRPLREITPKRMPANRGVVHEIRLLHPPRPMPLVARSDAAHQTVALPLVSTTAGLNFDGVSDGSAPPDTNGAVGATQFVQWVNTEFAVFDKSTGQIVYGPTAGNSLWTGFGGGCEFSNSGDIVAQYDKLNNRWVMSQFAISSTPYLQCVAVSTTSDATGSYNRYSFQQPNFNDYPKIGIWPDAYYASFNMFDQFKNFIGSRACAFDSASMRAGLAATQQCFQLTANFGGLLPSDVDGTTPPPVGSPNYYAAFDIDWASLDVWQFHIDFQSSGNSTFTGPVNVPVAPFAEACQGGTCIPQPGTTQTLDSLGDRLMYRLAYRNFGDHEALVANHSVTSGSSVAVRWYEIRSPGSSPTIYQQGTFAPDSSYRWMGSMAMDQAGDIALGYSVSDGSTVHPGIRYAGQVPGDPLGSLESEASIFEGTGAQTGLTRWGDYSAMSVDPVDDCTFWYTNEYLPSNGSWATRIASFKFTTCGVPAPDFSVAATPSSQSVIRPNGTSYMVNVTPANGFGSDVALSVSGLPAGASANFNPGTVTGGSGGSTLSVTTVSSTPAGPYTLTIKATSGTLVHSSTVQLVVKIPAPPNFTISVSPKSRTVGRLGTATYTVTVAAVNGFNGTVNFYSSGRPLNVGPPKAFSPRFVTGSGTATYTEITQRNTPPGTYTITLHGTSGSLAHTTAVTLVVQ